MYVEMKHVDEHCSNNNKTHENDAYKPEISRENKKREAKTETTVVSRKSLRMQKCDNPAEQALKVGKVQSCDSVYQSSFICLFCQSSTLLH